MRKVFGAESREVKFFELEGKPAVATVSARTYETTIEDLWNAITTPDRLARFFTPVEGDLRKGGRFQLKHNAEGTIERCDPPEALDLTWEFGGATSWVRIRLGSEPRGARITLEHISHLDGVGAEHFKQFGPAAGGSGWDLGFEGLRRHLAGMEAPVEPEAAQAWMMSEEGKAFLRASGEAWAEAHIAAGERAEEARARAERTIAFYTGG